MKPINLIILTVLTVSVGYSQYDYKISAKINQNNLKLLSDSKSSKRFALNDEIIRHVKSIKKKYPDYVRFCKRFKLDTNNIINQIYEIELDTNSVSYYNKFYHKHKNSNKVLENLEIEKLPTLCFTPNDTRYAEQWHLSKIQVPFAWDITLGNPNAVIGVVDLGFDPNQGDILPKLLNPIGLFDADFLHGLFVSGIAAAATNNNFGIAGVGANNNLRYYNGLDYNNILAAAADGATVINCSWAGLQSPWNGQTIIDQIVAQNIIIVASTGNGRGTELQLAQMSGLVEGSPCVGSTIGTGRCTLFPSGLNNVISVANTNQNDEVVVGNNLNNMVDIAAPGMGILSITKGNNNYGAFNGTSYAAPVVTGVVALMRSANPCLTPAQVLTIIQTTADPIANASQFPGIVGAGRINAYRAVKEAVTRYVQNQNISTSTTQRAFVDIGSNVTNTIASGAVNVLPNSVWNINAREVFIKNDFEVPLGSELNINTNPNFQLGCN